MNRGEVFMVMEQSRRSVIKSFFWNSSLLFFYDLFTPTSIENKITQKKDNKKTTKEVIITTSFLSLKFPNKVYENVRDFFAVHSLNGEGITHKRKRVFIKICSSSGQPISMSSYKNMGDYKEHISFLKEKEKYRFKVFVKSPSKVIFFHKDAIVIDTIS